MSKFSINTVYIWHRKWWPHLISHYLIQSLAQEQGLGLLWKILFPFWLEKSLVLLVHIFVRSCACVQIVWMIIHHARTGEGRSQGTVANAPRVCGVFRARANPVSLGSFSPSGIVTVFNVNWPESTIPLWSLCKPLRSKSKLQCG